MPPPEDGFTDRVITIFGRYKARVVSGVTTEADAVLLKELGIVSRVVGGRKPIRIDCAMGQHLRLVDPQLLSGSDEELAKFVEKTLG